METVLIVDDEKNYPLILSGILEEEGFETLTANNGDQALELFENCDIDLVLTDMKMPQMDGIELMTIIKQKNPDIPIIMMTAHGTVEKAVEAMQKGAYTYILKPFDADGLLVYVNKAIAMYQLVKENKRLRDAVKIQYGFDNIIGRSKLMQDVYETISKVAPTTATVLIEGESGTGKELVAKSIHFNSTRNNKPFIAINCAALAENLLESELFGHEKGAFTGAASMKKGRFELSDKGTLFIDEIGELSLNLQVKLLRVLQEKVMERVGGVKSITVDFRLIAATNKNLKDEITKGNFREDLYYRLNVVHITMPPLRKRTSDIPLLADHFIKKYSNERRAGTPLSGIDQEAMQVLFSHQWPGNVRELENVIERATILTPENVIKVSDLPKEIYDNVSNTINLDDIPINANLSKTLKIVEKRLIERALKISDNVQAHAAKLLGIGKSGLNQKIKKYKIRVGSKS